MQTMKYTVNKLKLYIVEVSVTMWTKQALEKCLNLGLKTPLRPDYM